jgi:2-(3-amino-3-carboxypropyl)histidine synthase
MPEGMLDFPLKTVVDKLSSLGVEFFLSGDPSYGACDIAIDLATRLRCDLLIHFGHTEFGFVDRIRLNERVKLDVIFIPSYVTLNISKYFEQLSNDLKSLGWKNIGLLATAQHLRILKDVQDYLTLNGFNVTIKGEGQILGCNIGDKNNTFRDFDGVISLHAGNFHTRGLLLSINNPILQLDPYSGDIASFGEDERNKIIKERFSQIHKAKNVQNWGVLGSTKIGQYNPSLIKKAENILMRNNKTKITIITENLNYNSLSNITWVEAWVDTACPRLIDDQISFPDPIINFKEFQYLFKEITWDKLLDDGFF